MYLKRIAGLNYYFAILLCANTTNEYQCGEAVCFAEVLTSSVVMSEILMVVVTFLNVCAILLLSLAVQFPTVRHNS